MTLRLILVRHAKSSWSNAGLEDHERPLNDRGKRSALKIGSWLNERNHLPQRVLSSDSVRTRETWMLIEGELNSRSPVSWHRALYHAGAQTMLDMLRSSKNEPTILMLGHNPGIAIFAGMLAQEPPQHERFRDYPTGATAILEFSATQWRDIDWGSAMVVDFAIPRELGA